MLSMRGRREEEEEEGKREGKEERLGWAEGLKKKEKEMEEREAVGSG